MPSSSLFGFEAFVLTFQAFVLTSKSSKPLSVQRLLPWLQTLQGIAEGVDLDTKEKAVEKQVLTAMGGCIGGTQEEMATPDVEKAETLNSLHTAVSRTSMNFQTFSDYTALAIYFLFMRSNQAVHLVSTGLSEIWRRDLSYVQ
ncbi:hypothetical protein AK812_SmicGene1, partial [Symbiodinium microadriaticum]